MATKKIKLNYGCASRPLKGYVNIDLDTLEEIKARYPNVEIPKEIKIYQYDIFDLPYKDGTVDEIKADSLLEHLSFKEEKRAFYEAKRVLKSGGVFNFSVPDFEHEVTLWLNAKDDWQEFYRDDPEAIAQSHWFGTYTYGTDNRWGYLIASIFGTQNSEGMFHKNAYTEGKIRAMCKYLDFEDPEISRYRWKGDRNMMLQVSAKKK